MSRRVITRVALKCNNQVLHWYLRQCLRCNISLRFFFSGVYRYYARLMVKESYHESSRASHDRSERLKNVTRANRAAICAYTSNRSSHIHASFVSVELLFYSREFVRNSPKNRRISVWKSWILIFLRANNGETLKRVRKRYI